MNSGDYQDMKNMLGNATGATYANFKGVMLCTRPVMKDSMDIERPYCFRVTPPEQLGLCPAKKLRLNLANTKKVSEYLMRHKKWIRNFQDEVTQKKNDAVDEGLRQELKAIKIKQACQRVRDDIRTGNYEGNPRYTNSLYKTKAQRGEQQNNESVQDYMNKDDLAEMEGIEMDDGIAGGEIVQDRRPDVPRLQYGVKPNLEQLKGDHPDKITQVRDDKTEYSPTGNGQVDNGASLAQRVKAQMNKKKAKPAFAMTEAQAEKIEDMECDDLLDFFDNTNYNEYVEDLEVKNMMASIKKRVDELKQEPAWQKKWNERLVKIKEKKQAAKREVDDDMRVNMDNDDVKTYNTGNMFGGGGNSVASDRTKESINELKEKMAQKGQRGEGWDKKTNADISAVALEERLAKHIADELLRNNMAMRNVHSNASIRKIQEQELKKELQAQERGIA